MTSPTRRLAAIMFTDLVGYTALMAESEEKGHRARERFYTPDTPKCMIGDPGELSKDSGGPSLLQ